MPRSLPCILVAFAVACATRNGSQSGAVDLTNDAGVVPDAGGSGSDGGTIDSGTPGSDAGTPDGGPPVGGGGGTDGGIGFLPLRPSPIAAENALPGDSGWQLSRSSTAIAAYAGSHSALPGEQVEIHAAARTATTATWELWRYGYYGGTRGRKLVAGGPVAIPAWQPRAPGSSEPNATLDAATGAVRAGWKTAFTVPIPSTTTTGIHLIKLSSALGETYAIVVVREPTRGGTVLYPVSTNTYQAYNEWGGTNLYLNTRNDWSASHAYAVSFDRPFNHGLGTGEFFVKDADFVTFAEGQGYDIAYVADADLDRDPSLIDCRRMVAFQGHSEYWTAAMRDAVERAIRNGTNAAFFAANNAYWQVRFADASLRTLIGYKEYASLDPANQTDPAHVTTRWRDTPVGRPENAMIGEMFGTWMWTSTPMRVTDPDSWIWTGAGVTRDAIIVGAYGDEADRRFDNGAAPASVTTVADSMVESYAARISSGESTLYTASSGAIVFSAGSITASKLVAAAGRWDARIQQLVANLFSRFAGDGQLGPAAIKPLDLGPGSAQPVASPHSVQVTTITTSLKEPAAVAAHPNGNAIVADDDRILEITPQGNVTVVAGSDAGFADGACGRARFDDPRGLAVASNGDIFVSDTGNHRIRLISRGNVTTLAGSDQGFKDATGSLAMFSQPMGIAMHPSGVLLVADSWNHRIRAVTNGGVVTTWAGTGELSIVDGAGLKAAIQFPIALAVMANGDVAVAEPGTGVVRKIANNPTRDVSSYAGAVGVEGWSDGPAADAGVSETIALAARKSAGELILIDSATARIRALHDGVIDTVAGGRRGGNVDGAGDTAAFGWPRGVAVTPDGSLYVVDPREHTLRLIKYLR